MAMSVIEALNVPNVTPPARIRQAHAHTEAAET